MTVPETKITSKGKEVKLVWHDEFDKDGLPDPTKWIYEEGYVRNAEYQYYTKERLKNCRIEGGRLIIEAHLEDFEYGDGKVAKCTSAALETCKGLAWKYGRFEVRAKVPKGVGTWPAAWMLGLEKKSNVFPNEAESNQANTLDTRDGEEKQVYWPHTGEIDIMEYVGFEPRKFYFTLHGAMVGSEEIHGQTTLPQFIGMNGEGEDEFALFAVEWDEDGIIAFFNDEKFAEYKKGDDPKFNPYPFDNEHYLLLNLAIGGNWGGQRGIDKSIFPARYEVDYVRVYQ